jgi:hypothetical protein
MTSTGLVIAPIAPEQRESLTIARGRRFCSCATRLARSYCTKFLDVNSGSQADSFSTASHFACEVRTSMLGICEVINIKPVCDGRVNVAVEGSINAQTMLVQRHNRFSPNCFWSRQ